MPFSIDDIKYKKTVAAPGRPAENRKDEDNISCFENKTEEIELEEHGERESLLESRELYSSSEIGSARQLNAHELSIDSGRDVIVKIDGEDNITSDAGAMNTILETINNRITFFEFAGESIYYVSHQIYLSPKTVYILVVDMSKDPDEKVSTTLQNKLTQFESWTYKGI